MKLFSTGEPGVYFDPNNTATLFEDAAGTIPTALERPVGLMLDLRDTTYSTYFDGTGDYLAATSGNFALGTGDFTIECWSYLQAHNDRMLFGYASSNANGIGVLADAAITRRVYIGSTVKLYATGAGFPLNAWFHLAVVRQAGVLSMYQDGVSIGSVADSTNLTATTFQIGASLYNNLQGCISNLRVVKGTALYTGNFTPPTAPLTAVQGTSLLTCGTSWSGNPSITTIGDARVDPRNPFKTGTGNHATSSSTARPTLTRRVNLLSNTEAFNNAVWGVIGVTKASTTEPSPKNTPTALKLTSTGNSNHQAYYAITPTTTCTLRFSVKKTTSPCFYIGFDGSKGVAYFDLINKQVSSLVSPATNPLITTNADDQSYVDVSVQIPSGGTFIEFGFLDAVYTGTSLSPWTIPTGATEGIVWGADLRPTNFGVGLPAYQRVGDTSVNAADYDITGFPAWLRCSGGQSMVTPSINFGTDMMTVWAGVRKLSDANTAMFTELSADGGVNSGAFFITAPSGSTQNTYGMLSRGTVNSSIGPSGYAAPITNVLSGIGNISNNQAILRINGTQAAISTANQGTGTYGNYPLYLFARNQSSLFFNGLAGPIIVRGAQSSAAEISNAENWINAQQKVY